MIYFTDLLDDYLDAKSDYEEARKEYPTISWIKEGRRERMHEASAKVQEYLDKLGGRE